MNLNLLTEQIYIAKGHYTFVKFAEICGIDTKIFVAITNNKLEEYPTRDLLERIANNSQDDRVNIITLLKAIGFGEN
jgi:hypothetical protein